MNKELFPGNPAPPGPKPLPVGRAPQPRAAEERRLPPGGERPFQIPWRWLPPFFLLFFFLFLFLNLIFWFFEAADQTAPVYHLLLLALGGALTGTVLFSYYFSSRLTLPLSQITRIAQQIAKGEFHHRVR
ncbi:MAG TPA: hypothetical protein VFA47_13000, partial [Candidatus Manganitrophaceae bacterium]|nr:hypothetical protein [Candidatus Manganitrophaceae bacterium]